LFDDIEHILKIHVRNTSEPMHQSLHMWRRADTVSQGTKEAIKKPFHLRWTAERSSVLEAAGIQGSTTTINCEGCRQGNQLGPSLRASVLICKLQAFGQDGLARHCLLGMTEKNGSFRCLQKEVRVADLMCLQQSICMCRFIFRRHTLLSCSACYAACCNNGEYNI